MTTAAHLDTMVAAEIMSAPVVAVSPSATLWEAWRLMLASGLRHLVVAEDGQCVGAVDDRIVFSQWPMGPLALRRGRVGDVMRQRTTCVVADTDLQTVAGIMINDGVDVVPVIDDDGTVLGVVTATDLTAAVAAHGLLRLSV